MAEPRRDIPAARSFADALAQVQERVGRRELSDDDLLVLCAEQIARSYTREERAYR